MLPLFPPPAFFIQSWIYFDAASSLSSCLLSGKILISTTFFWGFGSLSLLAFIIYAFLASAASKFWSSFDKKEPTGREPASLWVACLQEAPLIAEQLSNSEGRPYYSFKVFGVSKNCEGFDGLKSFTLTYFKPYTSVVVVVNPSIILVLCCSTRGLPITFITGCALWYFITGSFGPILATF